MKKKARERANPEAKTFDQTATDQALVLQAEANVSGTPLMSLPPHAESSIVQKKPAIMDKTEDGMEGVVKSNEKGLYKQTSHSTSKKNKKMKKQKIATVDNDMEMSKLNGEELLEERGELVLKTKMKSKKQKAAPVDNNMGVDKFNKKVRKQKIVTVDNDMEMSKLNGEELLEERGVLVLKKKKKSKKQKAAPVDNNMEMSKLNGEELLEEQGDLVLKKKKKSKKQKAASVNNMEMEMLKAEKLHEGEKSLPSKKKMKIKKKKSLPVDDNKGEKNTKGALMKGMKKWLLDYHGKRPGLHVLMQEIDEFIMDHEARVEKERKEREAAASAEGWTVVVHQKGRKKTVDAESGIAVGSVAEAAAKAKSAKKKSKETDVAFYRFQMREARRNEIMELQKKFDEDKKRIVQMRAARKFRPY